MNERIHMYVCSYMHNGWVKITFVDIMPQMIILKPEYSAFGFFSVLFNSKHTVFSMTEHYNPLQAHIWTHLKT